MLIFVWFSSGLGMSLQERLLNVSLLLALFSFTTYSYNNGLPYMPTYNYTYILTGVELCYSTICTSMKLFQTVSRVMHLWTDVLKCMVACALSLWYALNLSNQRDLVCVEISVSKKSNRKQTQPLISPIRRPMKDPPALHIITYRDIWAYVQYIIHAYIYSLYRYMCIVHICMLLLANI